MTDNPQPKLEPIDELDEIMLKPAGWRLDDYIKAKKQLKALLQLHIDKQVRLARNDELYRANEAFMDKTEQGMNLYFYSRYRELKSE